MPYGRCLQSPSNRLTAARVYWMVWLWIAMAQQSSIRRVVAPCSGDRRASEVSSPLNCLRASERMGKSSAPCSLLQSARREICRDGQSGLYDSPLEETRACVPNRTSPHDLSYRTCTGIDF